MPPNDQVSWTRYDARRMLASCLGLSLGAEIAHRRLCDHYWSTGRWVLRDTATFAEVIRCPPEAVPAVLAELAQLGWRPQGLWLASAQAKSVMDEALAAQAKASQSGRKAAAVRWSEPPPSATPRPPCRGRHSGHADAMRTHSANTRPSPADAMPPPDASPPPSPADAMPPQSTNSTVHNSTVQRGKGERLTRSVSPREEAAEGESAFFEHLEAVLQPTGARKTALEMENWGGWWRNRYRENPGKTQRVIDDVANMVKEGRIIKSFGAAAVDLWGRLPP